MIARARQRCVLFFRLRNPKKIFGVRRSLRTKEASRVPEDVPTQERFPRSGEPPAQSPKYWVKEKDRYLRQLLIRDIEAVTKRPLVVFFSQLDQQINHTDPDDLSEILLGVQEKEADLFIQTPGGNVDATEKIISILSQRLTSYRLIV